MFPKKNEKLEYFEENGYVVFEAVKHRDVADAAKSSFYQFKNSNAIYVDKISDEFGTISRIINLHAYSDRLFQCYTACQEAVAFCEYFLGGSAVVYTSLYFERGSNQALHRDTPYFVTNPLYKFLGFWVALDDVDENNGPLMVIPGSHSLDEENLAEIRAKVCGAESVDPYSPLLWDEYQARVLRRCEAAGLVSKQLHVNKGDVVIWHPKLMHGGSTTLDSAATRNSIVFHVIPKRTKIGHQDAFYGGVRLPAVGASRQKYASHNIFGRKFISIDAVGFSHDFEVNVNKLF